MRLLIVLLVLLTPMAVAQSGTYSITVLPGWNLIGLPQTYKTTNAPFTYTLFRYDGKWIKTMPPYQGGIAYWLEAGAGGVITFNGPSSASPMLQKGYNFISPMGKEPLPATSVIIGESRLGKGEYILGDEGSLPEFLFPGQAYVLFLRDGGTLSFVPEYRGNRQTIAHGYLRFQEFVGQRWRTSLSYRVYASPDKVTVSVPALPKQDMGYLTLAAMASFPYAHEISLHSPNGALDVPADVALRALSGKISFENYLTTIAGPRCVLNAPAELHRSVPATIMAKCYEGEREVSCPTLQWFAQFGVVSPSGSKATYQSEKPGKEEIKVTGLGIACTATVTIIAPATNCQVQPENAVMGLGEQKIFTINCLDIVQKATACPEMRLSTRNTIGNPEVAGQFTPITGTPHASTTFTAQKEGNWNIDVHFGSQLACTGQVKIQGPVALCSFDPFPSGMRRGGQQKITALCVGKDGKPMPCSVPTWADDGQGGRFTPALEIDKTKVSAFYTAPYKEYVFICAKFQSTDNRCVIRQPGSCVAGITLT